jgi:hypothetical protein
MQAKWGERATFAAVLAAFFGGWLCMDIADLSTIAAYLSDEEIIAVVQQPALMVKAINLAHSRGLPPQRHGGVGSIIKMVGSVASLIPGVGSVVGPVAGVLSRIV